MYKFHMKNGTAYFYEHGVEIDGTVYGIHTDRDILRIKRRIVNDKFAETDDNFDMGVEIAKIQHTDITFEQPTAEQLEQIQAKTYNSMTELKQHVQSIMNGELTQDEINAMLLLRIAEMEVAITNEQTKCITKRAFTKKRI